MCDRPLPQQALCGELAALLDVLPDDAVPGWLAGFWDVVASRWTTGIDVLRMEKFLLLVRRVLGRSLAWVREGAPVAASAPAPATAPAPAPAPVAPSPVARKTRSATRAKAAAVVVPVVEEKTEEKTVAGAGAGAGSPARAEAMLALFREWPFEPTGDLKKMPAGLRLHVLDIWVDEAEKVGMLGEEPEAEAEERTVSEADAAFLQGLREILQEMVRNTVKPVKTRAKEGLADERLPWNEKTPEDEEMTEAGDEDEDDGRGGWGGFRD